MTTIQVHRWGFHLFIDIEALKEPQTSERWGIITIEDAIKELKAAAEVLEREQKKNGKNSGM